MVTFRLLGTFRLFDFSFFWSLFDFSFFWSLFDFSGLFDFSTFRLCGHFSTFRDFSTFCFLVTFRLFAFFGHSPPVPAHSRSRSQVGNWSVLVLQTWRTSLTPQPTAQPPPRYRTCSTASAAMSSASAQETSSVCGTRRCSRTGQLQNGCWCLGVHFSTSSFPVLLGCKRGR